MFMRGNLFMICQQWAAVISFISRLFPITISEQCVPSWCGILLEQLVFFYDTYVKYGSARKRRRKLRRAPVAVNWSTKIRTSLYLFLVGIY
jgi:hypothetical protein